MKKIYYYKIHDIIGVSSTLTKIIPSYFNAESLPSKDFTISTCSDSKISYEGYTEITKGLYVSKKEHSVISIVSVLNLKLWVRLSITNKMELTFSDSYISFAKYFCNMPFYTITPPELIIKKCLQYLLNTKGYTFFIAGGIYCKDHGLSLVTGSIGSGKSTSIKNLIIKCPNCSYLGDDTLITNGDMVYAYPLDIRVRSFGNVFFSFNKYQGIEEILNRKVEIKYSSEPKKISFLETGSTNVYPLSKQESKQRLAAVTEKIINLETDRLFYALAYCNLIDLDRIRYTRQDIFNKLAEKSKSYIIPSFDLDKIESIVYG
jgi:hypothetical protein